MKDYFENIFNDILSIGFVTGTDPDAMAQNMDAWNELTQKISDLKAAVSFSNEDRFTSAFRYLEKAESEKEIEYNEAYSIYSMLQTMLPDTDTGMSLFEKVLDDLETKASQINNAGTDPNAYTTAAGEIKQAVLLIEAAISGAVLSPDKSLNENRIEIQKAFDKLDSSWDAILKNVVANGAFGFDACASASEKLEIGKIWGDKSNYVNRLSDGQKLVTVARNDLHRTQTGGVADGFGISLDGRIIEKADIPNLSDSLSRYVSILNKHCSAMEGYKPITDIDTVRIQHALELYNDQFYSERVADRTELSEEAKESLEKYAAAISYLHGFTPVSGEEIADILRDFADNFEPNDKVDQDKSDKADWYRNDPDRWSKNYGHIWSVNIDNLPEDVGEKISGLIDAKNRYVQQGRAFGTYRGDPRYTFYEMRAVIYAFNHNIPIDTHTGASGQDGVVPNFKAVINAVESHLRTNVLEFAIDGLIGKLIDAIRDLAVSERDLATNDNAENNNAEDVTAREDTKDKPEASADEQKEVAQAADASQEQAFDAPTGEDNEPAESVDADEQENEPDPSDQDDKEEPNDAAEAEPDASADTDQEHAADDSAEEEHEPADHADTDDTGIDTENTVQDDTAETDTDQETAEPQSPDIDAEENEPDPHDEGTDLREPGPAEQDSGAEDPTDAAEAAPDDSADSGQEVPEPEETDVEEPAADMDTGSDATEKSYEDAVANQGELPAAADEEEPAAGEDGMKESYFEAQEDASESGAAPDMNEEQTPDSEAAPAEPVESSKETPDYTGDESLADPADAQGPDTTPEMGDPEQEPFSSDAAFLDSPLPEDVPSPTETDDTADENAGNTNDYPKEFPMDISIPDDYDPLDSDIYHQEYNTPYDFAVAMIDRYVNNIYFDSTDMLSFNPDGNYGEEPCLRSMLESGAVTSSDIADIFIGLVAENDKKIEESEVTRDKFSDLLCVLAADFEPGVLYADIMENHAMYDSIDYMLAMTSVINQAADAYPELVEAKPAGDESQNMEVFPQEIDIPQEIAIDALPDMEPSPADIDDDWYLRDLRDQIE